MDETEPVDADGNSPTGELQPGASVGRYVLSELIGAGSMGAVFAAVDPELDRAVALKIVPSANVHAERARRLTREARALASLNHPNVVTVHDVGTDPEGRVFIAMELVHGQTLAEWLETDPPLGDRRRVLARAGRGLRAAHDGGLVHRDIKPDNIMLAEDGRVVVLDFGLAQAVSERASASTGERQPRSELATHGVVGTPAYMAPEQAESGTTTTSSDQFSFCLVMWRVLYGERPFGSGAIAELRDRIAEGSVSPASRRGVPRRLRRAMLRGLALDHRARWPSLDRLIVELERRSPARSLVLAGAAVAAVGLTPWIAGRTEARCADADAFVASAWDGPRRETVRASLASASRIDSETSARITEALDAYAASLAAAWREACEPAEQGSASVAGVVERCIALRRDSMATVVESISARPDDVALHAVDAIEALPDPARCVDPPLHRPAPPAPELADAVQAADLELNAALALANLGRLPEALERLESLRDTIDELGYQPQVANARLTEASIRIDLGEPSSVSLLEQAYGAAVDAGDHGIALEAATGMVTQLGTIEGRPDAARAWASVARAHIPRSERGLDAELKIEQAAGLTSLREGELERGVDELLSAWERAQELDRLSAVRIELASNLAVGYTSMNRYREAERYYELARVGFEARYGARHVVVGRVLSNEGHNLLALGRPAEGVAMLRRGIEIIGDRLGPDHPLNLSARSNLGAALVTSGDLEGARETLEGTVEMAEARYGPRSAITSTVGLRVGRLHVRLGQYDRAEFELSRALARCEAASPEGRPRCGLARAALGHLFLVQGRASDALPLLDKALVSMDGDASIDDGEEAQTRLYLGHALIASAVDVPRGRRLFDEAARAFEGDEPRWAYVREELERFRQTHP